METMKFKVGDKVRVKSLEWYNSKKNFTGCIMQGKMFTKDMIEFCGKILTIEAVCGDYYKVEGNSKYWQDWMLEDEVVTEEKQLNKNDMETKEMTQEEVLEFLKDTKILCTSKAETIQVQVKLFQFGIEWICCSKKVCEDKYLLFINQNGNITYCSDIEYWMEKDKKRIEPSEVLAIQIKEEKPKFDLKALLPFDKVLARNNDDRWCARFFDFYEDGVFYTASGEIWDICIPYNEETKNLHGTTDEEPEFYRI